MVFVPNISFPTDREIGVQFGGELICIAPPPMAWGDSPPWPYDEQTMLMHSYRVSIVQFVRLKLIPYLRENAERVTEAAKTELPVNDQFRAQFPAWEDQFTELCACRLPASLCMACCDRQPKQDSSYPPNLKPCPYCACYWSKARLSPLSIEPFPTIALSWRWTWSQLVVHAGAL
jgi:hypothetical protein